MLLSTREELLAPPVAESTRLANGASQRLVEYIKSLERDLDDRTRQVAAHEQLAYVGSLVQGIFHNIRNPISALTGFMNLIADDLAAVRQSLPDMTIAERDAKLTEALASYTDWFGMAKQAEETLLGLIETVITKCRQDADDSPSAINFNALVAQECAFLEADGFFKHNIEKVYDFDETLPPVCVVYRDFSRAVTAILSNAMDALREVDRRTLRISTRHDDLNLYLEFSDNGMPMFPDGPLGAPALVHSPLTGDGRRFRTRGLDVPSLTSSLTPYDAWITFADHVGEGSCFTIVVPKHRNCATEAEQEEELARRAA
jgi:signal transduction histidine kinase